MNASVEQYLDAVCTEIRYRKAHAVIRQEITGHIADLQDGFMAEGMSEEEAVRAAIKAMGDPKEVGHKLHLAHKPKTEWSILILLLLLVGVGFFTLIHYQGLTGSAVYGNRILKQGIALLLGGGLAALLYFIDYHKLEKAALPLYLFATLLLFLGQTFGLSLNQRGRWFSFSFFSVDITAVAFCLYLIAFAGVVLHGYGEKRTASPTAVRTGLVFHIVPGSHASFVLLCSLALFASLLLSASSLINGMFMGFSCLSMLAVAFKNPSYGANGRLHQKLLCGSVAGVFLLAVFFMMSGAPFLWQRLMAFLNPFADPAGTGYMGVQIHHILSQAQALGSVPQDTLFFTAQDGIAHLVLPDANTGLVYTYIIAVFGWLFAVALAAVIGLLLWRMVRACYCLHDGYAQLLTTGIMTFFALQFLLSLLMNVGLFPITGISLPFISYGGSMMVTDCALLGLFLGIYRRKDLIAVTAAA